LSRKKRNEFAEVLFLLAPTASCEESDNWFMWWLSVEIVSY